MAATTIFKSHAQFLLTPLTQDGEEQKKKKNNNNSSSKCCSCHDKKYELVGYDSLPNFLKHNEFILDYYRSEWPLKQSILSIFSIHNETLNIWTHFIGFFVFLSLTICTAMMVPMHVSIHASSTAPSRTLNVSNPNIAILQALQTLAINATTTTSNIELDLARTVATTTRWPFYAYLMGAMFCLLMSSSCHLLSCHSEYTSYVMLRLDYAGITGLIVTSFYPLVYYSFMCNPFYCNLYITFITLFGVAAVLVSLIPVFETPEFRTVRAGLFVCMGLSGLVPIMHKFMVFGDRPEAILTTGYEMVMLIFYGLGVIVYAARVPERWMPGKFDLAGHSHQLFHVLVIAGAYTHYLAGLVYLRWRDLEGC